MDGEISPSRAPVPSWDLALSRDPSPQRVPSLGDLCQGAPRGSLLPAAPQGLPRGHPLGTSRRTRARRAAHCPAGAGRPQLALQLQIQHLEGTGKTKPRCSGVSFGAPPPPKITPRHVGHRRHPPGAFWSVVPGKAAPGGAEGIFSTSRRRSAAASGERSQHPADSQLLSAGPAARGWLPPLSPTSPSPRGPTQGVVLHHHKGPGLFPRAAPQPPAVTARAAPQGVKPPGTCSPSAHPKTPLWSFWGEDGEKHAAVALPSSRGNSCHQDVAWPRRRQRGHGAGRGDVTLGMPPAPVPRPPQAHRPRRGSHSPPPPVSTGTVFNKQRGIF